MYAVLGDVEFELITYFDGMEAQFGMDYVHVNADAIDPAVKEVMPSDVARKYGVVPVCRAEDSLTVALSEPVLMAARRRGAAIFDRPLRPAQWRRQLRLLRASVTGAF